MNQVWSVLSVTAKHWPWQYYDLTALFNHYYANSELQNQQMIEFFTAVDHKYVDNQWPVNNKVNQNAPIRVNEPDLLNSLNIFCFLPRPQQWLMTKCNHWFRAELKRSHIIESHSTLVPDQINLIKQPSILSINWNYSTESKLVLGCSDELFKSIWNSNHLSKKCKQDVQNSMYYFLTPLHLSIAFYGGKRHESQRETLQHQGEGGLGTSWYFFQEISVCEYCSPPLSWTITNPPLPAAMLKFFGCSFSLMGLSLGTKICLHLHLPANNRSESTPPPLT